MITSHKIPKGQYGYLNWQKKCEILKTLILFGIALVIYLTGLLTLHTNKNIYTLIAALGCIPASNSAVRMIMFLRASGCSESVHDTIKNHIHSLPEIYDLYFTTYQKNYSISHAILADHTIIFYSEDTSINVKQFQNHIASVLSSNGYDNITIFLFQDLEKYINQIKSLEQLTKKNTDLSDKIIKLLLNISL